jgi:2-keto-4-pentenoate hydratase/2-oxohepta-3-ene-1,7-dioic acid hydratase in catechol pathway
MKFFRFSTPDRQQGRLGVVAKDGTHRICPESVGDLNGESIENGVLGKIKDYSQFPLLHQDFLFCAPIQSPKKIIGVAGNFGEGLNALGIKKSISSLSLFSKSTSSLTHPNSTLKIMPTQLTDFEAELAVIIGTTITNGSVEEAERAILGFAIANDISDRALQGDGRDFFRAKSRDGYCPLGPYLVTSEELLLETGLEIRSYLNDTPMQCSSTREMRYSPAEIVQFVSTVTRLLPGDIILLGAPAGYGMHQTPPRFLKEDDQVRIEITGLGEQILTITSSTS